jgi:hypothetical protein
MCIGLSGDMFLYCNTRRAARFYETMAAMSTDDSGRPAAARLSDAVPCNMFGEIVEAALIGQSSTYA